MDGHMWIGEFGYGPTRGFAYLFLLIAVGGLAATTAWTVHAGAALARQGGEAQLMAVGGQFSAAFESYARATPLGQHTAPRTLEELLRDPRYPQPMRHLRKLFDDPLTGKSTWGVLRDSQGYIVGIHSLAPGKPIKQFGFAMEHVHLEQSETYADWVFRGEATISTMPVAPSVVMPTSKSNRPN